MIALTDGEIAWDDETDALDQQRTTALPPSLLQAFVSEPLWVDVRFARTEADVSIRQPAFRNAVADLAAPIHGSGDKDTLLGEDIAQHRRTMRLARGVAAVIVALAAAASVAAVVAVGQRDAARTQRDNAISLALATAANERLANRPDESLLLSLAAFRTNPSPQARSSVIAALETARLSGAKAILHGHTGPVYGVAFSPDGHILASAGFDGTVRLWDLRMHEQIGPPLRGHTGPVYGVAFSPDGRTLASASFDGTVRLWDVRTHDELGPALRGHTAPVYQVVFGPHGHILASISYDGTVRLWDIRIHKQLGQPLRIPIPSFCIAFSPVGHTLASADGDNTVRMWNVRTHKQIGQSLRSKNAWAVAFSPDGCTLASASIDRTVRLWNVRTHKQIRSPLDSHTDAFHGSILRGDGFILDTVSVAFSRDGHMLATAGFDRTRAALGSANTRAVRHAAALPQRRRQRCRIQPRWAHARLGRRGRDRAPLDCDGARAVRPAAAPPARTRSTTLSSALTAASSRPQASVCSCGLSGRTSSSAGNSAT